MLSVWESQLPREKSQPKRGRRCVRKGCSSNTPLQESPSFQSLKLSPQHPATRGVCSRGSCQHRRGCAAALPPASGWLASLRSPSEQWDWKQRRRAWVTQIPGIKMALPVPSRVCGSPTGDPKGSETRRSHTSQPHPSVKTRPLQAREAVIPNPSPFRILPGLSVKAKTRRQWEINVGNVPRYGLCLKPWRYTWCITATRVLARKCPPLPGDPAVLRLTPQTLDQTAAFCLVPGLLTATGPGQDPTAVHRAALFSGCLARPRHGSLAQVLASSYSCKGAWISHTGQ